MLPPEPAVLAARYGFIDAQASLAGAPVNLGSFSVSWYGTNVSDERGSFGLVNPAGPLANFVGDYLQVTYNGQSVIVYIIGSYALLTTALGLARRPFMAVSRASLDPLLAPVEVIQ